MYGWIWERLPGNTLVRALLALLLFMLAVAVLFTWVFPWAEPLLPFNDVTVNGSGSSAQPAAPSTAPSTASTAPSGQPSAGAKSSAPTLNGAALPTYVPLAPTGVPA
jgi:hypothetical protein